MGGRVEQVLVDDGRPVQLGGELVGHAHTAYLALVEELGLTLTSTYTAVSGATTYDLVDGVYRSEDGFPFATPEQRADHERVERLFGELVCHGRSRGSVVAPGCVWPRRRIVGYVAPLRGRAADDGARGGGRRARPRGGIE